MNVVVHNFNDQLLRFLKELLVLNKDVDLIKELSLEAGGAFMGSRVPRIESQITLIKSVVEMIKTLPNPLDYGEHIKLFEQEIEWAKKDKQEEMKRDFTGWIE
jgi:hypothetical protein